MKETIMKEPSDLSSNPPSDSNASNYKRNRVLIAFGLIELCMGILYMWSVFAKYVMSEFAIPKPQVAMTGSMMLAGFVLGILLGGRIQDKTGPRPVVIAGIIAYAGGLIAASFAVTHGITPLYITYGIIGGIGVGAVYNTALTCCQKWFPDKKGFAAGVLVCFFGFSVVLFTPVAEILLTSVGLQMTWRILGIIFLVVCMPISILIKNPPAGYMPVGYKPLVSHDLVKHYTTSEMLKKPSFYYLTLSLMLITPAYFILMPLLRSIGESRGLSPSMALFAVMVTGIASSAGRLICPWISDHIGRENTNFIVIAISACSSLALISAHGILFLILVAAVSFSFGSLAGIYPPITSELFGWKHLGANYGCVMVGYGVSALVFPYLANIINSQYANSGGTYTLPFIIPVLTCIVAFIMVLLVKKAKKEIILRNEKIILNK